MAARRRNENPVSLFAFQDIITAITGILILFSLILALSVIVQGAESSIEEIETHYADDKSLVEREDLRTDVQKLQQELDCLKRQTKWRNATPASLKKEKESTQRSTAQKQGKLKILTSTLKNKTAQLNKTQELNNSTNLAKKITEAKLEIEKYRTEIDDLKKSNLLIYNFKEVNKKPWLVEVSGQRIIAAKVDSSMEPKIFTSASNFSRFASTVPGSEQYFVFLLKPTGVSNYETIKSSLLLEAMDIGVELVGERQSAFPQLQRE
jgi:hypothetical protein